jgi:hypothetical protein
MIKARLYRGPKHGKIYAVADKEHYVVVYGNRPGTLHLANDSYYPNQYTLAMNTPKYVYVRTHHTHPDGSVYFEWDKPKGTKI